MYVLGIDLGTTYTAASVWRDGHAEICSLGSRATAIPSVVLFREDETFLTGETASRRGVSEPHRVAREFKRRVGDTTPILLGGVPYSAEKLMARLLQAVVDEVVTREGGRPAGICVSHPANWGPYKTDLMHQAVRLAGLEEPVVFTTEPEAAAIYYAHQQRIQPGAIVAVYDLGGGTFDAAVLRKTQRGFEILGQPEGIERLGGIDFDAAVFGHVARALEGKLEQLDEDDPSAIAAVSRLKEECTQAKEALSADTDVSIPVLLPNVSTEIRLTRAELESMVRPALYGSIEALRRALRSAGVSADQLHSVLLVGGSSRMPIVAQLVGAELGRPVAVDAHPKHVVALGAALLASGSSEPEPAPQPAAGQPSGQVRAVASVPVSPAPAPHTPQVPVARQAPSNSQQQAPVFAQMPALPPLPDTQQYQAVSTSHMPAAPPSTPPAPPLAPPAPPNGSGPDQPKRRLGLLVAGGIGLSVVLIGVAVALALDNEKTPLVNSTSPQPSVEASAPASASPSPQLPADERCTKKIKNNTRWVCLTEATFDGTTLTITYEANFAGASPRISGGYHLHIYGGDGTDPQDAVMGTHASPRGVWYVEDQAPSVRTASSKDYQNAIGDAPKVCARIADSGHRLVPDNDGNYHTGNCVPIKRI